MEQDLENTIALLARFPKSLDALLRGLPDAWILQNEGPGTWNCFDVVGHLVHLENRHRMERINKILRSGEGDPFEPVDRWAQSRESAGKTIDQLLDEFAALRSRNLQEVRSLSLEKMDLSQSGRHAALGVVALSEVLASWVVHDLTHLHQISRILAHQYREAVGPWSVYLGVLQCAGHSRD